MYFNQVKKKKDKSRIKIKICDIIWSLSKSCKFLLSDYLPGWLPFSLCALSLHTFRSTINLFFGCRMWSLNLLNNFHGTKKMAWDFQPLNIFAKVSILNFFSESQIPFNCDMVKHELGVESLKAQVEIQKCEFESNARVTSSNPRVQE